MPFFQKYQISVQIEHVKEFEKRMERAEIKYKYHSAISAVHSFYCYELKNESDKKRAFKIRDNIYK